MRVLLQSSVLAVVLGLIVPDVAAQTTTVSENQSCPAGMLEVAKFDSGDLTDGKAINGVTIDNLTFKDEGASEVIGGDWTATSEIMAVVVKGGQFSLLDEFFPRTSGSFSNEGLPEAGNSGSPPAISNLKFCRAGTCEASTFSEKMNRSERTVTLTIRNSDGITQAVFRKLTNFTVDFSSSSNGSEFLTTDEGKTWSTSGSPPAEVTFVLQAPQGATQSTYFAEVTSDCKGGFTTFLDPTHSFPEMAAKRVQVSGNAPNPFRTRTTINFTLPEATDVQLTVYDVMGREIATLVNRPFSAGTHEVQWSGRSGDGRVLPSGAYFYRLEAGNASRVQRMTLVR